GRDQPRAAARGGRAARPAGHDDAGRAVSLRALGRPGALSADERQLRPARAAGAAGEGQAEKEGAAGRAGAGGYRTVRGADRGAKECGMRSAECGMTHPTPEQEAALTLDDCPAIPHSAFRIPHLPRSRPSLSSWKSSATTPPTPRNRTVATSPTSWPSA